MRARAGAPGPGTRRAWYDGGMGATDPSAAARIAKGWMLLGQRWDDAEEHRTFVRVARAAGQEDYARRRYEEVATSRPGDPHAAWALRELGGDATEAVAPLPPPSALLGYVAKGLAGVMILYVIVAFVVPQWQAYYEQSNAPPRPAKRAPRGP